MSHRPGILVVGCGAMGGVFAAHLAHVAEVAVLATDAAHVTARQPQNIQGDFA